MPEIQWIRGILSVSLAAFQQFFSNLFTCHFCLEQLHACLIFVALSLTRFRYMLVKIGNPFSLDLRMHWLNNYVCLIAERSHTNIRVIESSVMRKEATMLWETLTHHPQENVTISQRWCKHYSMGGASMSSLEGENRKILRAIEEVVHFRLL